ncbi:MAG: zf-HC2 domain-containing protein [Verrucomicrobiota bacterium]
MKCESTERDILLAQSGELSWLKRRLLERHLAVCPRCRGTQVELDRLAGLVRGTSEALDVSQAVIERIHAVARKEQSKSESFRLHPSREPFHVIWRPALLYAAVGVVLLTGFWLVLRPALQPTPAPVQVTRQAAPVTPETAWEDSVDDEIAAIDQSLVSVSDDSSGTESAESEDLDAMARELLELEGMQI